MVWEMLRNLEMFSTHSMPFFPAALLPFIHPPLPISLGTGIDGSCTQNCVLLHLVSKWIRKAPAKQQKFRKRSWGLQMQHPKRGFKTIQNCPSFNEPLTALSTAAAVVSLHAISAQQREHPSLYRKRNYPIPIAWGPCAPVQLLIAANFQPFRKHLPGAMRSKRREVSFAQRRCSRVTKELKAIGPGLFVSFSKAIACCHCCARAQALKTGPTMRKSSALMAKCFRNWRNKQPQECERSRRSHSLIDIGPRPVGRVWGIGKGYIRLLWTSEPRPLHHLPSRVPDRTLSLCAHSHSSHQAHCYHATVAQKPIFLEAFLPYKYITVDAATPVLLAPVWHKRKTKKGALLRTLLEKQTISSEKVLRFSK